MSRSLARRELAGLLELTLRSVTTRADVERACAWAIENRVHSICLNSSRLVEARHYLEQSDVKVTCAIGFPLGAAESDVKRYETEVAVDLGAHFVEVSINLGLWKDGDESTVLRDLSDIVEAADERPVSFHLGAGLMSNGDLERFAALATQAGAKSLTILGGEKTADVLERLVEVAGPDVGLKVDQEHFQVSDIIVLLEAWATRFGVADGMRLLDSIA